ncbi:ABC transporter permease [Gordonia sihwensis]|uniref:ABC transporter permease n=1 Tax=Gordonia TaxID=2053 RepID=UPI002416D572|nr:ABC transporter permease [Gordonia sihwensis]WFN94538.1 ABC transporter permease [Gordonia sihwensis]
MSQLVTVTDSTSATTMHRPIRRWVRTINASAESRLGRFLYGAGAVALVFAVWQVLWSLGVLPATALPSAGQMLGAFLDLLGSGAFWASVCSTVSIVILGLVVIIVIAAPLSILLGLSRFAEESTWLVVEFLKPIPPVALIPLGLLLWGPTPGMKMVLIVFGAIWPLLTQLVYGVREVNATSLDMARSYHLGWWLTTSRIVIPSMTPFAMTGLRIAAAIALIISIVTEMIGGAAGLGQDIVVAQSAGAIKEMYALIFAAGLLGLLVNTVFKAAEKPLLFWHPSHREEAK